MAKTAGANNRTGFSRSALHLIWTLPFALLIGYPLWFAARLGWCGYGGCFGSHEADQQANLVLGIELAILCALLVIAAITIPPWFHPWWVRLIAAIVLAVVVSYVFGWGRAPSVIPFLPTIPFGGIQF
jgi:hypothetical protein